MNKAVTWDEIVASTDACVEAACAEAGLTKDAFYRNLAEALGQKAIATFERLPPPFEGETTCLKK